MRRLSLRGELLAWVVIPLAVVVGFNVWTTYRSAIGTADLITNRTLLASARVIAEDVRASNGSIEAPIPPAALEMFASDQHDIVVYQVIGPNRDLIAGTPETQMPTDWPIGFETRLFETSYRGQPMRSVAISQPLITADGSIEIVVSVGQTLRTRDSLVQVLWLKALRDQVVLLAGAAFLTLFGLRRGLAPLMRLRATVLGRRGSNALEPLSVAGLQTELQPLVNALNDALNDVRRQIATQRRFVANAAHQLRTPLALLRTQANVGLREGDLAGKTAALTGIDATVERMARLSTQLLALARAEQGSHILSKQVVDFGAVVRNVLEDLADQALARNIDLGFEGPATALLLDGHGPLLAELVHNLVDNAIRYGGDGGRVTVSLSGDDTVICLRVEDSGPGIPPEERNRVFERFYRALGTEVSGTGLGLAIAREIVASHDGSIELQDRQPLPGLVVVVLLPRAK